MFYYRFTFSEWGPVRFDCRSVVDVDLPRRLAGVENARECW